MVDRCLADSHGPADGRSGRRVLAAHPQHRSTRVSLECQMCSNLLFFLSTTTYVITESAYPLMVVTSGCPLDSCGVVHCWGCLLVNYMHIQVGMLWPLFTVHLGNYPSLEYMIITSKKSASRRHPASLISTGPRHQTF